MRRGVAVGIIVDNLAFTKTFTEIIDYIHLGIATNTPVILEGGTGLESKLLLITFLINWIIESLILLLHNQLKLKIY